jgi:hypothetical protein
MGMSIRNTHRRDDGERDEHRTEAVGETELE